ncbi:FKBP-type peptidyl-prolyl cis-trans isomerase [bacterium]|nr:MAG: FKBP-type peptidyl-prolyl cis-trans isomerase [bacterium]
MVLSLLTAILAFQGGLVKKDIKVGVGPAAKKGDYVTVDYTGKLTNGKQFDSSIGRGPFAFKIGEGRVIKGWDLGVAGMKVGGKRKLTIPASLGYGAQAMGDKIPANSTLVFDIELKAINVGVKVLKKGSGAAAKEGDSVSIFYTGTLRTNGKQFDSNVGREPFDFQIGRGVVPGFSVGVTGMRLGEKRRVTIPSALGYGPGGTPDGAIPPNADLVFEIELVGLNGARK